MFLFRAGRPKKCIGDLRQFCNRAIRKVPHKERQSDNHRMRICCSAVEYSHGARRYQYDDSKCQTARDMRGKEPPEATVDIPEFSGNDVVEPLDGKKSSAEHAADPSESISRNSILC